MGLEGPSSNWNLVLSLNQGRFFGCLLGYNRLRTELKNSQVNSYVKKKGYQSVFTLLVITLSRPINPIGLVEFALGSLGPLGTVSFQQFLTASSLFLCVA